jgi:uncharacterized protein (DUF2141 family)
MGIHMTSVLHRGALRRLLPLALMLGGAALAAQARAADLTVRIGPIDADEGTLYVAVFGSGANFPREVRHGLQIPASLRGRDGTLRAVFADLPPGRYALTVFHDKDGNGKLTANLMGQPTEPYAFSNDAKGAFGPPRFEDAAFDLPPDGASVVLSMPRGTP